MGPAMNRSMLRLGMTAAVAAAASVVGAGVLVEGRQASPAVVFTARQATEGRAGYAKHCVSCHMPDLSGSNEIPALAGTAFMDTWGARSTKELFDYLSVAMPYGAPSLTPEAYTSITAYILQVNGAAAGTQPLTASTTVPLGSLMPARSTPPPATARTVPPAVP